MAAAAASDAAGKIMKAVQYEAYGGGAADLKHVEVPVPAPKKDEILLKVEATSINPIDWKVQKGMLRPFLPPKFPFVPGVDVAGEVAAVGGDDAGGFNRGDKVITMLPLSRGGGLAEFAVATKALTVLRPSEVSPASGAGLPTAAVIALQALRASGAKFDGPNPPMNILVTAASGGVGHYAVQLARLADLHITATCSARNTEFVKGLGADEVLDYRTPDGAALRSPSGRRYDAVVHCTAGIPWSTFEPNLSANGKVIDISPSFKSMVTSFYKKVTFSKKKLATLVLVPNGEDIKFVVKLVREEKLKTFVDSRHGLEKAEDAWAKSISGHATGKIIVEMI